MTWAATTPATAASDNEPRPSRMWLRVYTRNTSGRHREIRPRTAVADTLDPSIMANPVKFPPCQCRAHRQRE
ncbi:hypothetical protein [Streptomyces sp. NPDC050485]|uniref:hypothetical protein n=1 Tax=Streptomyces sp. NPDC050485 TaxID=3365617 RepID=UPI0037A6533A